MKSRFIVNNDRSRLILIFAGWGMDWRVFASLASDDYDIMVVWDYRVLTHKWTKLKRYDEICLIAWSMGVFAASLTIHEISERITKRIAVNGTLTPVSDTRGIPTAIFRGTLNALAPGTLRKFYRQMCATREQYEAFKENGPRRSVTELINELQAIQDMTIFHVDQIENWDMALVSRGDAIFPPTNQYAAWRGVAPVVSIDGGHLPDFKNIIDDYLINKARVQRQFAIGGESYHQAATVQQNIARVLYRLFESAAGLNSGGEYTFDGDVLEVGCGTGALTALYAPHHRGGTMTIWDIVDRRPEVAPEKARFVACDAEVAIRRTPTRSVSFLFSSSTIQWLNSPASFLRECERVLMPDGFMVLSTFVANNLEELNQVAGVGLRLPSLKQWQAMFSSAMTVYVCQSVAMPIEFDTPRDVLKHLSATGVNAVADSGRSVSAARRLLEHYPRTPDGRCQLTYRPVFIIARRSDII